MTKSSVEKLVEVEYHDTYDVQIIHINSMTRAAVDTYVEVIKRDMVEREDSIFLSVQDYSKAGGMVSPYFLGRMKEFSAPEYDRIDAVGRVAVVNSMDIFRLLLNPLMRVISRGSHNLELKFFSDLEDAVSWVSEYEEVKDPE